VKFRDLEIASEMAYFADRDAEQMWSSLFPILFFVMGLGEQLVWYAGGRQVIHAELSLGTLVLFLSYLYMFYGPLQYMSNMVTISRGHWRRRNGCWRFSTPNPYIYNFEIS